MASSSQLRDLLRWYVDAGADEAIGEEPANRYQEVHATLSSERRLAAPAEPAQPVPPRSADATRMATPPDVGAPRRAAASATLDSPEAALQSARGMAAESRTLDELADALRRFDGCALKHTATNLVFGDGNPDSAVMLIGEAPGAEEDREGVPFVGVSGRLLDHMMAAIGLDRGSAYITNILYWRPPGNRKPTTTEAETCLPFVRRHINLVAPRVLVPVGGTAAAALLARKDGITKMRGTWFTYRNPDSRDGPDVPTMPIYHPAYLLRQPTLKRDAWRDLLEIKLKLGGDG